MDLFDSARAGLPQSGFDHPSPQSLFADSDLMPFG
jgi:hypothetical protein